jgi:outer membrane protein assembly factor BamB
LTFDGIDQQYVAALDKRTGKTVWRTDRSTDYHDLDDNGKPKLDGDLRKAYGTPAVTEVAGRKQLISVGSRAAFGYDVATGREIWTVTHEDFNAAAPPLFYENLVIINTGSGGANLMAIRLDESTQGNVTDSHVVWNRTKGNSRLSAPALDGDRLWMLTDNGVLYALDAKTGKELAVIRLGGSYVASPIIVGGHLYACDEEGTTNVVRTSIPPKIVAKNQLDEGMRASPAVAHGALYLRTYSRLYMIFGPATK